MANIKSKFIIIDGNALIHRSFHALPPTMTAKNGEMTNAVYGFATVLIKAIKEFRPEYVVLTLDKKGPTFRHKKFKAYKAKRVKAPDELYAQIPKVKKIADSFNIPIFEKSGFEADDLIGTIANKLKTQNAKRKTNIETIIVTGDLDTLQLIDDNTKIYTMSRGLSDSILYDEKAVRDRFGLSPEQMIDYKALRGDPSDNIPGVRGIGEKTAIELLKRFKTLNGIYEYLAGKKPATADKIKNRIKDLLLNFKKDAYLSRDLVIIKTDVPIEFNLEAARFHNFDRNKIFKTLSDFEFKSLLPRVYSLLNSESKAIKENTEKDSDKFERNKKLFKYRLVDDEKKFNLFLKKLKKQKQFAFDTETSSFDPLTADLLGISFSWKEGEAYYLEVRSNLSAGKAGKLEVRKDESNLFNYKKQEAGIRVQELGCNPWLFKLKAIFENEKIKKFGHNIKFDLKVMKTAGLEVKNIAFDTMVASYILDPGSRQHNLDLVVFRELQFEKISKDDLLGKGRDKISFSEVAIEKLCLYSCEDADFTYRLVEKLGKELKKQQLDKLFYNLEMPLVSVLAKMEESGVILDKKFLAKMSKVATEKIKRLEEKIYKQAGVKFNINSTQQLRKILFEKLEIPISGLSKTKTGISTAADELVKLKDLHPIIPLIQEYRELNKLTTTYIDALPELINKKTNRLHTSYNQTITATGRLSSTEPNLQNIPIKTELGKEIRKAFGASKGYKLLALDYSQIELRLAAHMSEDKKMIKAFKEGADIHAATAAKINQIELSQVTKEMRREAKAVNFGILYGQGPHGLSQTADIPYWRAKEFIDKYFATFPDIKKFIDQSIRSVKDKGYAETLFSRKRNLPEINSSVIQVKKAAERMAINTPLQGTAADMIKSAMIEIDKLFGRSFSDREKNEKNPVYMLLQVHDELIFEVKESEVKKYAEIIKNLMESVIKLNVPVVVEASAGDNWGELEKLETEG